MLNKRKIGNDGEEIACRYLVRKGYVILDRNYRKKYGELDIVCKRGREIEFIEVKSVRISGEDQSNGLGLHVLPEENVHARKMLKIRKMVMTYLEERGYGVDYFWNFGVACVYIDYRRKSARIRFIGGIIL